MDIMKRLKQPHLNALIKSINLFKEDEDNFKLPYIVVIVDEFADLISNKIR